jgi:hypothetical protein
MRERDRRRHIAASAESRSREAAAMMTEDERLEAEAKGHRTSSDSKASAERLKDEYDRRTHR